MSLMEKDKENEIVDNKDKANFIVKYSATLNVEKFLNNNKNYKKNYDDFILESISLIYNNLLDQRTTNMDNLGLWILFEDGERIDNSISISTLDNIKKYSMDKNIKPIQEFFKMTIEQ